VFVDPPTRDTVDTYQNLVDDMPAMPPRVQEPPGRRQRRDDNATPVDTYQYMVGGMKSHAQESTRQQQSNAPNNVTTPAESPDAAREFARAVLGKAEMVGRTKLKRPPRSSTAHGPPAESTLTAPPPAALMSSATASMPSADESIAVAVEIDPFSPAGVALGAAAFDGDSIAALAPAHKKGKVTVNKEQALVPYVPPISTHEQDLVPYVPPIGPYEDTIDDADL
jgi:hypothetical protein